MKKKRKHVFLLLCTGVLLLGSAPFAYGKEADLVKEYIFEAETAEDLAYEAPEEIREGGKRYRLTDVSYELVEDNRVSVTKKVATTDKEDFEKEIEHKTETGKRIKLTADGQAVSWSRKEMEPVTITQSYATDQIPGQIETTKEAGGEEITILLSRASLQRTSQAEEFSAPAVFYSPVKGGTQYEFNGKVVTIAGAPTWEGYEKDVIDYLDAGSDTVIDSGAWTSGYEKEGDQYVRRAVYTGTKGQTVYRAVFTETEDTLNLYSADVTYTGIDPDKQVLGKAIASYEKVFAISKGIMIGAGIAILALALAAILFFLKRRRESE